MAQHDLPHPNLHRIMSDESAKIRSYISDFFANDASVCELFLYNLKELFEIISRMITYTGSIPALTSCHDRPINWK